jgi:hypothetical protein
MLLLSLLLFFNCRADTGGDGGMVYLSIRPRLPPVCSAVIFAKQQQQHTIDDDIDNDR